MKAYKIESWDELIHPPFQLEETGWPSEDRRPCAYPELVLNSIPFGAPRCSTVDCTDLLTCIQYADLIPKTLSSTHEGSCIDGDSLGWLHALEKNTLSRK